MGTNVNKVLAAHYLYDDELGTQGALPNNPNTPLNLTILLVHKHYGVPGLRVPGVVHLLQVLCQYQQGATPLPQGVTLQGVTQVLQNTILYHLACTL